MTSAEINDTIKSRIAKVLELARRGATEGERNAAEQRLQELLHKYGVSLEDVIGVELPKTKIEFEYTEQWERDLIVQIASCVRDASLYTSKDILVYSDGRMNRTKVKRFWLKLTKAEAIEVQYLWPKYQAAYKEQLQMFYHAFIAANELGISATGERKPLTPEERARLRKMLDMAESLGSAGIDRMHKLLGDGAESE